MSASSIRWRLRHSGLCARVSFIQDPPLGQTTDGCVYNRFINTDLSTLIRTKLSFQMNLASICVTIMAAFLFDAMMVNGSLQSVLTNDIVAEQPVLWYEVWFRIMNDPVCIELRAISIETSKSVKCYSGNLSLPSRHPFQQDNAPAHDEKTVRDFCWAQHIQLLPWTTY